MNAEFSESSDLLDRIQTFVDIGPSRAITSVELNEFEELLRQNEEAQVLYLELIDMMVCLPRALAVTASGSVYDNDSRSTLIDDDFITETAGGRKLVQHLSSSNQSSSSPFPIPTFLPTTSYTPFTYLSSGWPVAYLIATVIFGIGALIGTFTYVSHPGQVARETPAVTKDHEVTKPQGESVGRITGMVDCKWAHSLTTPVSGHVAIGQKLALASGLMEITYDTGAKVILQGPITYDIESPNGGFLSIGKLVGKAEVEKATGFVVRTPTAVVTDLGTEFGVEVFADRAANVCVYDGVVEVAQAAASKTSTGLNAENTVKRRLVAGQALRLEAGGDLKSLPTESVSALFVRRLPVFRATPGLEQGLVAYWSFDNPANLGKNSTGGGDLAMIGSPAHDAAGLLGGALRLHRDVKNDTLLYNGGQGVPKGVPTGNASYSISAWYRVESIPIRGIFGIVSWGDPSFSKANGLTLSREKPEQYFVQNYWWDNDLDGPSAIGGWHHVATTYNHRGRMQYLYLDGMRIGLRAVEQRPDFAAKNFAVGRRYLAPDHSPKETVEGLVDEIGIWNRELLEPEISRLYNNCKGFNPWKHSESASDSRSWKGGEMASTSN